MTKKKAYKLIGKDYEDLDNVLARVIPDAIDAWLDKFPDGLHSRPTYWNEVDDEMHMTWTEQLRMIAEKIRGYEREFPHWDENSMHDSAKLSLAWEEAEKAKAVEALVWLAAHFRELWD